MSLFHRPILVLWHMYACINTSLCFPMTNDMPTNGSIFDDIVRTIYIWLSNKWSMYAYTFAICTDCLSSFWSRRILNTATGFSWNSTRITLSALPTYIYSSIYFVVKIVIFPNRCNANVDKSLVKEMLDAVSCINVTAQKCKCIINAISRIHCVVICYWMCICVVMVTQFTYRLVRYVET